MTMTMPAKARALLRTTPTIAPIINRSVLSVVGSQASEFLQGLLASSVTTPERGPFYSAVLNAQGRVLHDIFVYTQTNANGQRGYLVEHEAHSPDAPSLLTLMKRHVLRSKVRIRDVSEEYNVWAAWGSEQENLWDTNRRWMWARSGAVEPVWDPSECPWGAEDYVMKDRRAAGMGSRLLVKNGERPQLSSSHDTAPSNAYLLHRILHGVPEGSLDIPYGTAFPMDSNLDIMGALDFRKGCYVGQELTVRTYHTGVVRKRILPVMVDSLENSALPAEGTESTDIRAVAKPTAPSRPRGTGKLLSNVNGIGLALLRLEHLEGVQAGHLDLELGSKGAGRKIVHWWPDWWPHRPDSHPEESE